VRNSGLLVIVAVVMLLPVARAVAQDRSEAKYPVKQEQNVKVPMRRENSLS
jgi:hypothetical protein